MRKVMSLLDRRAFLAGGGGGGGAGRLELEGRCMRHRTVGLSLVIAVGKQLGSLFEVLGSTRCWKGKDGLLAAP
ncbi:unnamed protein product [Discosporangium mesarthrocarpum]